MAQVNRIFDAGPNVGGLILTLLDNTFLFYTKDAWNYETFERRCSAITLLRKRYTLVIGILVDVGTTYGFRIQTESSPRSHGRERRVRLVDTYPQECLLPRSSYRY